MTDQDILSSTQKDGEVEGVGQAGAAAGLHLRQPRAPRSVYISRGDSRAAGVAQEGSRTAHACGRSETVA